jgi:saccharopine dehydrogenase-like NADP-dependent oxidoreductase
MAVAHQEDIMKIAVVGAGGKQASGVIRDLAEAAEVGEIALLDLPAAKTVLEQRAREWCRGKGEITLIDVQDPQALRGALRGATAASNCTTHHLNLTVMEACLAEGVHYTDLGGLFYWVREQMKQNEAWKARGLTAVLGMGSAPGIVNVLGRYAVDMLDSVDSFLIRDGIVNLAKVDTPLVVPYALGTILDEFEMDPWVFEDGDWKQLKPFARPELIEFPEPVGSQTVFCTLHSEVATVPVTFRHKGLKHMSFKLALPKVFEEKMKFLVGLGFGNKQPIEVAGQKVSPREVLVALAQKLPKPTGKPDDHKVLRVDVTGRKDGEERFIQMEMACHPYEPWGMAGGPFTVGFPVAVVLRLLGTGVIKERGALPAEACVPPEPFFAALAQRGLEATVTVKYSVLKNQAL